MIIHSIVWPDIIFEGFNEQSDIPVYETIEYNGIELEVSSVKKDTYKVNRIISSNPFDYLIPEYQPGTLLKYQCIPKEE